MLIDNKCCIEYKYLRPKKALVLKKWHNQKFTKRDILKSETYQNSTILPLKRFNNDSLLFGRGGVVDDQGNYVDISSIVNRVQYSYDIHEEPLYDNSRVVYCGYMVNQWGHFLVEAVSRLWYFFKNDQSVDKYVFFLNYNETIEIKGNYKEFFELLGIWDKLEFINKPTKYREVIVPELSYKWREYYSSEYKEIFDVVSRNIIIDKTWGSSEKIYFTRSQLKKSNNTDIGSEMLDDYFSKNGYEIIAPEKISLSRMIFLIDNAKEIASVSGSLPHNMLFGKDGKKITIIERNVMNNEIQVDINNIRNLSVTYVDANAGIYPINLGYGPFIILYNNYLENFTVDNNYIAPEPKYNSENYIKKCFKRYMKEYRKVYNYSWFMFDWMIGYTDYIYEAYNDSLNYFGRYINGKKPFKFSHYFMPKYIKNYIKSLLK